MTIFDIIWDSSKLDGMPRKLMDVSKMRSIEWKHDGDLKQGIQKNYDWFLENVK